MCSDAPDYGPVAEANERSAQLAADVANKDLAFRKQQYADLQPYITRQLETGAEMSELQKQIAIDNNKWATQERDRKAQLFQPVERQMVNEAMAYGSEYDQQKQALKSAAQIDAQTAMAQKTLARNNAAMGINPASGRAQETALDTSVATAALKAGAMNDAANSVKDKGIALRSGVSNYGVGLGNTAANAYSTAVGAGSSSAATAGAGVSNQLASAGYVSGGVNNVMGAQQMAIDSRNSGFQLQAGAEGAASSSNGAMAGAAIGGIAMAI